MTATVSLRPPRSADGDTAPPPARSPRVKLSFSGSSFRALKRAARRANATPQDFVRQAVKTHIYLQEMESRGFTVLLRNADGVQFVLPPELPAL